MSDPLDASIAILLDNAGDDPARVICEAWSYSNPDDTDPKNLAIWQETRRRHGGLIHDMEPLPGRSRWLRVWRGQPRDAVTGFAWSLDPRVALTFARSSGDDPVVITGRVRRNRVLAYISRRNESEVLVQPDRVHDVAEAPVTLLQSDGCDHAPKDEPLRFGTFIDRATTYCSACWLAFLPRAYWDDHANLCDVCREQPVGSDVYRQDALRDVEAQVVRWGRVCGNCHVELGWQAMEAGLYGQVLTNAVPGSGSGKVLPEVEAQVEAAIE